MKKNAALTLAALGLASVVSAAGLTATPAMATGTYYGGINKQACFNKGGTVALWARANYQNNVFRLHCRTGSPGSRGAAADRGETLYQLDLPYNVRGASLRGVDVKWENRTSTNRTCKSQTWSPSSGWVGHQGTTSYSGYFINIHLRCYRN